ncbi:hypothetical protein NDU88_001189 [Pleurodeles waltl]|uniref:Integrase p58-like C-terminal domain-containing protein n=1 Tax=Pleurodeles waltl TaxID=8319 RepID=A0AAV7Q2E0_PLEWA|nr:hypothetical protein NDU88_001189 [Pleurodeles waltl]
MTAGCPPLQQPKDQEAENPKNRPHSGESVALAEMLAEQWEQSEDDLKDILTYTRDLKENLHKIWEEAHKTLREAQVKQKAHYDALSSSRSLTVGQKVLVLLPFTENKLLARWQGPYNVLEQVTPTTYKIEIPNGSGREQIHHINLLKTWYPSAVWLYQPQPSGGECDGSIVTESIPQYPWGTIASGFPDPDAVLSGSNEQRRLGDDGVFKTLLDVAQGATGETSATGEKRATGETRATRETVVTGETEEMAAAQEIVAAPVVAAAAQEMAAALEAETLTTPGGAVRGDTPREVGRTVRIQPCPADTELRPTTAGFPQLQQPMGHWGRKPQEPATLLGERGLGRYEDKGLMYFYSTSGRREGTDRIPTLH